MKKLYAPIIDTKEYKLQFLRGQPYNITAYIDQNEQPTTSYLASMTGRQQDDKAKIIDMERTSCGAGAAIPDPMTMTMSKLRMQDFSNDLRRAEHTQFSYTGDNWHVVD